MVEEAFPVAVIAPVRIAVAAVTVVEVLVVTVGTTTLRDAVVNVWSVEVDTVP
jgi:hypothetical protein